MRNIIKKFSTFLLFLIFILSANTSFAQNAKSKKLKEKETKEYFDESGGFKHRLWYGIHFAGNIFQFTSDRFRIAPIVSVGYKATDRFSVGLVGKMDYSYERLYTTSGKRIVFSSTDFGGGAFARFKFVENIFGHAELEATKFQFATGVDIAGNIIKQTLVQQHCYLGGGYRSGMNNWGYEIMLLYNVLDKPTSVRFPIDIRIGFSYKF